MKILVACERTQAVCRELRFRGHEAYSCDILPCSGGHPEWHLQQDVLGILDRGWDIILAFPPCTDLCVSGARWFTRKRASGQQQSAIDFFMRFAKAPCDKICIENPVGIMSSVYQRPQQIIHPYMFGDPYSKKTCLWLKNLPKLIPTNIVSPGEFVIHGGKKISKWYTNRLMPRDRTFPGIAQAMATQFTI